MNAKAMGWSTLFTGLALGLVAVSGCLEKAVPGSASTVTAVPTVAAPAAGASTLQSASFLDPQGGRHTLAEYKGTFVVLTQWASWCPHCQVLLPRMQKDLFATYSPQGIAFVNVETSGGSAPQVLDFATKFAVTMPLFADENRSTVKALPNQGYPTIHFITPDQQVLSTKVGALASAEIVKVFKPYLKPATPLAD